MSYHYTKSSTSATGQVAPSGYHYMPDGTLMSDVEHARLYGSRVISSFDLDFSDLPAVSEKRSFTISGNSGAEFILEIKDNDTGKYYNFTTGAFQVAPSKLEKIITKGRYRGSIVFPAITGSTDQYDIYLYAKPGTTHASYREVRFKDNSVDINSSKGSNSLMMQKVIYQYTDMTLTIGKATPNATIEMTGSGHAIDTVTIPRGKEAGITSFTVKSVVSTAAKSYRIIKQPTTSDIFARTSLTVGSAPEKLPGENIYPTVTGTDTVNGDFSGGATAITMDSAVASKMAVGDRVTGNAILDAETFTVASIDSTNVFSLNASAAIADDITLSFSNQKNYQWPLDDINKLPRGAVVQPGTNVTANTVTADYEDTVTLFEGREEEEEIIKHKIKFKRDMGNKPTISKGLVSIQAGNIIFNNQQVKALAGDTITIGGYGEEGILKNIGYNIKVTDLKVELTPITTTTTAAVVNSTSVIVAEKAGIINGVSTVSGIGIDSSTAVPTVSSGGGASGSGTLTLSAAQNLESGTTLTFGNTGQVATITGNIEVLKTGAIDEAIYFDVEKLLSIT